MKKLISLAVLAATSSSVFANNEISDVFHTKFATEYIEVHFRTPENRIGDCLVKLRQDVYPNTDWLWEQSRNEPGSPSSARQWADFNIPWELRKNAKQIHISCPTQTGEVTYTKRLPAPPKTIYTLEGVAHDDGGVTISGGLYVEGNASGTFCQSVNTNALVGHEMFKQDLSSKGGFYSAHIALNDTVDSLYHGYGNTRIECTGEGGTTVDLIEFRTGANGTVEIEQNTITWK